MRNARKIRAKRLKRQHVSRLIRYALLERAGLEMRMFAEAVKKVFANGTM